MPRSDASGWLREAATALRLQPSDLIALTDRDASELIRAVGSRFVADPTRRWWWEGLLEPCASRQVFDGRGYELAARVVPASCDRVLLVPSDDEPPPWPVFDVARGALVGLLRECPHFEYLLVAPDRSWIVGENHHDFVFAAGQEAVGLLEASAQT